MFQPDPHQWPKGRFPGMLPPHFLGGVAPSRHDVAHAAHVEKQAAHGAALAEHARSQITIGLRDAVLRMGRRLSGAARHLQHGRFGIAHLRDQVR